MRMFVKIFLGFFALVIVLGSFGNKDGPKIDRADDPSYASAIAQHMIKDRLFDPDSAQFKNIYVTGDIGNWNVSGLVNAKNKFGGYVGYKYFTLSRKTGALDIED